MIRFIERRRSEVIHLIRDREKTAVDQAEDLLKQLEKDIDDLKRRDAEMEQLLHTDDDIYFLQVTHFLNPVFLSFIQHSKQRVKKVWIYWSSFSLYFIISILNEFSKSLCNILKNIIRWCWVFFSHCIIILWKKRQPETWYVHFLHDM